MKTMLRVPKFRNIVPYIRIVLTRIVYCYILFLFDSWVLRKRYPLNKKTLLLVRLDAIGDYVLSRNFFESLRRSEKYQGYSITLCGNVAWKDLAEEFDAGCIDDFIWVERGRLTTSLGYRRDLLSRVQMRGFEVAVQPVHSREFLLGDAVIRASGAPERIGSCGDLLNITRLQKKISDRYYTRLLPASPERLFEFTRNREFFSALLGQNISWPRPLLNIADRPFGPDKYIVVMPGAGADFRRWAYGNFAEVIRHIAGTVKIRKVFVAGGREDIEAAEEIARRVANDAEAVIVAGKLTLPEFARLLAGASLLLTNETGAAHIAAAVKTKTISISNGNYFGRWHPYPREISEDIVSIYPKEIEDRRNDLEFLYRTYGREAKLDINAVRVEDVIPAVDRILA